MIEVKRITQSNPDTIEDITLSHSYDKENKVLHFKVTRTPGITVKSTSTNTAHPKYEFGLECYKGRWIKEAKE